MAAWVNAFLVPGITVVARKYASSTYSLVSGPTAGVAAVQGVDWDVDSFGVITVLAWAASSLTFFFTDTGGALAATPEYPAISMRGNFDSSMLGQAPGFGFTSINEALRGLSTVSSNQAATTHQITGATYNGGNLVIGVYNDGSITTQDCTGTTFALEVDITSVTPGFWTDFESTLEDSGVLTKLSQRVLVPEQPGVYEIPASFDCYPPAPDPPGPPPSGGGNGSGPPHGDCYLSPIYQAVVSCGGYPPGDPLATQPCTTTNELVGYQRVCP